MLGPEKGHNGFARPEQCESNDITNLFQRDKKCQLLHRFQELCD